MPQCLSGLLGMIVDLVSHELVCVHARWILFEAEMYVLVAFHLISFCFSCLALVVCFFFCLVMFFFFL